MKLGKINTILIIFFLSFFLNLNADNKIISAPIINLENLEPSYENLENDKEISPSKGTKIKKRSLNSKKK